MKNLIAVLAISGVLSTPAMAADAMALAKSKNCLACHAMDKKLVGPSFKDIAAKYASDKGAVDKLAVKIMKGGAGVWGAIPMPANNVTDAEAKSLAAWVLTVK
jgi:cytochrome c